MSCNILHGTKNLHKKMGCMPIHWVTHKRKDSKLLQEELTTTKWSNEYGEVIFEVPRWEMQHLSGKFGTYEEVERPVLAKKMNRIE